MEHAESTLHPKMEGFLSVPDLRVFFGGVFFLKPYNLGEDSSICNWNVWWFFVKMPTGFRQLEADPLIQIV